MLDSIYVVCMVEMSSDGRERVHVLVFSTLPVMGTIGGALRGSGQNSIFAVLL